MSAAAVLPVFRIVAPEFGPHWPTRKSNDEVLAVIGLVLTWPIAVAESNARYNEAVAELAAHKFTMDERVFRSVPGFASTGPVANVSVKGAAFSHTPARSPAESYQDDQLQQTTHGLAYLGIRDECAAFGGVFC